jgi:hypothetical protein
MAAEATVRRVRRGAALAVVMAVATLAVWFVGLAGPAAACSCMANPPEPELDAMSEIVIVGRVTAVSGHESSPEPFDVAYEVDVEVVHKGDVPDPATLWTAGDSSACGIRLELGELYKLYPRRTTDGRLHVGLCDGHRPATDADLAPPTTTPTTSPTPSTTEPEPPATTTPPPSTTTLPPSSTTSTTSTTTPLDGDGDADEASVTIAEDGDDGLGLALPAAGAGAALSVLGGLYVVRRRQ